MPMRVLAIHGDISDDAREAVEEAIEQWWGKKEPCDEQLLVRLPRTRVIVDVCSTLNPEQLGTIILENETVTFIPVEGRPV